MNVSNASPLTFSGNSGKGPDYQKLIKVKPLTATQRPVTTRPTAIKGGLFSVIALLAATYFIRGRHQEIPPSPHSQLHPVSKTKQLAPIIKELEIIRRFNSQPTLEVTAKERLRNSCLSLLDQLGSAMAQSPDRLIHEAGERLKSTLVQHYPWYRNSSNYPPREDMNEAWPALKAELARVPGNGK